MVRVRGSQRGKWPPWVLFAPLILLGVAAARWLVGSLPPCVFHEKTGLLCPGCGATRAALALGEGRWLEAFQNNAFFVMTVILGLTWIVMSAVALRFPQLACLGGFRWRLNFLWWVLATLLIFLILRNVPGVTWLGPSQGFLP